MTSQVNIPALQKLVSDAFGNAVRGWQSGLLVSEEPLLNRLFEQLGKSYPKVNLGRSAPLTLKNRVEVLHRKAKSNRDRFGSDFAITVSIPSEKWRKTAFFQLKTTDDDTPVRIKREQIKDAHRVPFVRGRAFVMVVDRRDNSCRIAGTPDCESKLKKPITKSVGIKLNDAIWLPLGDWIKEWMACKVGLSSEYYEPERLERELLNVALRASDPRGPVWAPETLWNQPKNQRITRCWAVAEIGPAELGPSA